MPWGCVSISASYVWQDAQLDRVPVFSVHRDPQIRPAFRAYGEMRQTGHWISALPANAKNTRDAFVLMRLRISGEIAVADQRNSRARVQQRRGFDAIDDDACIRPELLHLLQFKGALFLSRVRSHHEGHGEISDDDPCCGPQIKQIIQSESCHSCSMPQMSRITKTLLEAQGFSRVYPPKTAPDCSGKPDRSADSTGA